MNRRRRGLVLVAISAVLALLGASALSRYVADVDRRVGPLVSVVRLRHDIAAHRPVTPADVEVVPIPRRWSPPRALAAATDVLGQVAATSLGAGTLLTTDLLAPPPTLGPGQREVAILIDAETGVAGRIEIGGRVDIVATFAPEDERPARSEVVVAGVEVLAVGDLRTEEGEGFTPGRVVPVTFALSVHQALVLTYAESFAVRVRLAAVAPADTGPDPADPQTFTLPDQPADDRKEGEP